MDVNANANGKPRELNGAVDLDFGAVQHLLGAIKSKAALVDAQAVIVLIQDAHGQMHAGWHTPGGTVHGLGLLEFGKHIYVTQGTKAPAPNA